VNNLKRKLLSKKILALLVLIIAGAGFGAKYYFQKNENNVQLRENKVERGNIEITILSTGTVQPENRLEIKAPIPGRVEKILIKEGDYVKKGKILAWMSSAERATLLDSAQASGEEEVKKWEEIYRPTPIIAPIDGTIVLKNIENGQTFTTTDAILVMSDRLTVKAQVDETDIASIKLKQAAEITLDAYPETKISAQIDQIAFEATTVSNVTTYIVDVLPKEIPSFMRSGMTANVKFFMDGKNDVLTVPNDAVKIQDGKSTVIVLQDGDRVEREIEIGITDGKKTEVISGLNEGDIVFSAQIKPRDKNKSSSSSSPFAPGRGGGKKR
jgi:macrolide-specific efflux system membrane fusion protein